MKKTRWLSVVLALVLVFSLCTSAFAVDAADSAEPAEPGTRLRSDLPYPKAELLQTREDGQYKAGDQVRAIVLFDSQPTADNRNAIQRSINTPAKLILQHTKVKQMMVEKQMQFKVNFEYTALLNGMSITVDYAELDAIAALPGVSQVFIPAEYKMPVVRPSSNSASDMIGASTLSKNLYADGSGMVIAVLDTGITSGHEAFAVYPGMLQDAAWKKVDMIKAIAGIGHGMYVSEKIPFQFDYADQDNDATDDNSGHGSHVAGIAAGYVATDEGEITFTGSAPDAQILAMKVFSSQSTTTSSDIYFAALEDAYKLGADVINMSLGAPNGFVEDAESVLHDRIYERLENAGVIACIAAGNEDSMAEYAQNRTGGGYVTTDYADYGVLGSPASYNGNVAVASMENAEYPAYMITVDGKDYGYLDSDGTAFHDKFAGQELEYVMVPDLGVAEAYENIDVKDKIAVISRGEITFEEKVAYASAAGAAGVIVYDNTAGALVSMAVTTKTIPAVFVSQETGAALAAYAEAKLTVNEEKSIVKNPEGWSMSSFSSRGPTNDLQIKPTITGIGGNVNSVLNGTENGYTVNSGTSMATPNVAGGYAAYLEAIYADNEGMSKADAAALARNRTLSHAYVAIDYADQTDDGSMIYVPFSPRRQGAGVMDLAAAYTATLAITDPLVELGDDPAKSGVFTINAELENTGDTERTFDVSLDVLCDALIGSPWGTVYNAMQSQLLEDGVDFTSDAPESVTLAAGEKKTVTVTITLTADAKEFLDSYFANGTYIEGYLYFDYYDAEGYDYEFAHVTYMGFYGDWAASPILETHDWRDLMNVEIDPEQSTNPMDYVEWETNTTPTMAYLVDDENTPKVYAGDAPFGYPEGGAYSEDRIAVSYNADSAYFTKLLVVPTIIRNARHIVMIARDAETNEIYAVDDTPYCAKTIFDPEEGGFSTHAWFLFDGTNIYSADGEPIADDTKVVLDFYANLPYGEDALGSMTPEEILAEGAQYLQYSVPVVVDGAAPEIESCEYDPETGDVTVTVSDNQYLAAIYAVDTEGNDLCDPVLFADDEAGKTNTVTFNVGQVEGVFYVASLDYATNESYKVVGPHDHEWSEWTVLEEATCEEEGQQGRMCAICGEIEYEAIPALGHSLTKVAEVPATCETDGTKEHWKCDVCGKLFADEAGENEIEEPEVIPALGHDLKKVNEVPAACEAAGVKEYWKCDNCGKLFADEAGETGIEAPEVIPATGHSLTKVDEVPATCEAAGVKAHWKCDACGKLFADAEGENAITEADTVLLATGHCTILQNAKDATCTEEGYSGDFYCIDCKKVVKQGETIAKLPHTLTKTEEVPATCEADGVKEYWTCSVCGKLFADEACTTEIAEPEVIAKLGHDWDEGKVTKQPTLAENGEKLFTCKNDPSHTRTEPIAKLHDCDGGDTCPSKQFTDVDRSPESWSHEPIDWAVLKEITNGTTKTTFSPDNTCTRAQAVTFLWRAAGCPEPKDADSPFKDVTLDSWYAKAVLWAVEQGITNGTSATTFSPDDTCIRGQIVTFLWRMQDKPTAKASSSFKDVPADAYFAKAVDWAVEQGITNGVDDTHFAPEKDCTRAHIVTFLFRQFEK